MRKTLMRLYSLTLAACLSVGAVIFPLTSAADDKIKPEEIVAKHLASVGSAETRASITSRIIAGTVVATISAPKQGKFSGECLMVSDGGKNTIGMGFESPGKFEERFAFDGATVTVGYARPGNRGYWGDFLLTHENIIKLGLVGGALSQAWPLFDLSEKKQKLEYRGLKKMGDHSLHQLEYIPKGTSDLTINLFFDSETFQHVRSEYTRVISAGLGSGRIGTGRPDSAATSGAIDGSGQQRPTRYKMTEEFSNFSKESGLNLPHTYKIKLELDTRGGTQVVDWEFTLTQFAFNQPIPTTTFNVK